MNEQKKQKLIEQYDDAAFALLMDEYAESEGARLMAEFAEAQAAGQVPEMPRELDEQCRRMIRRDRTKKRGRQAVRRFGKITAKVAIAVLVFIGLMTTVVMSVEAFREPVLNFIVEHYEEYISITTNNESTTTATDDPCVLLDDFLPDDYSLVEYSPDPDYAYILFENTNGEIVTLSIVSPGMAMDIDRENADYSEVILGDYLAILLEKNGFNVIWCDDAGVTYLFRASALTKGQVLELCTTLAMTQ